MISKYQGLKLSFQILTFLIQITHLAALKFIYSDFAPALKLYLKNYFMIEILQPVWASISDMYD